MAVKSAVAVANGLALLVGLAGPTRALAKDGDSGAWSLQQAIGDPDDFKLSGSFRARYEALDNQFRPKLDSRDDILVLRTTLAAEYDSGPVRVGAELMDSRAYFDDAKSSVGTGEVNALELAQAYVGFDLGDALGKGSTTTLDAGRFTMDLGSRRLVARNNFRNTTNAFTGFKAQYQGPGKTTFAAFYTLPNVRVPDDKAAILDNKVKLDRQSFNLTFWGAFAGTPLGQHGTMLEAYFYGLDENDSPQTATRNRHLYTPGLRLYRKPKPGALDYEFEGALQFGTIRASTAPSAERLKVRAGFAHASLGYQFASAWKPHVAIVYDLATGDDSARSYGRFDTLYGARRFDFGPTGIYGPVGRANVSSPGVQVDVKPTRRFDAMAKYRAFWLASATDSFSSTGVRDATGAAGKFAGQQVEARLRYALVPGLLNVETGGAVLFEGHFLKTAPNATGYGNPLYGYFEVSANF